jgi:homoserine O-acetyltransferase
MPSGPNYSDEGLEYYEIPDFSFSNGTTLHDVRVAYRSYNPSSTAGVVLIPTCYAGFVNTTLNFTSAPYDALAEYHVVVVAMLGNGESSSPSNKSFFPLPGELRYEDVVRAQHDLLTNHLKATFPLEAVIGFSMGGQQAYHWGVMYPDEVKRVVPICSSARTSLHNYAFLEGPIAALASSIDYVAWRAMKDKTARGEDVGPHLKELTPKRGLKAFARAYAAWLTSTRWFRDREFTKPGPFQCDSVEEWMVKREEGYMAWDADDLLVLARMWQMGDVGCVLPSAEPKVQSRLGGPIPDDNLYQTALQSIKAKVLLMPCRTDQYFPPEDSEIEMKHLQSGTLAVIESSWGHTAGGGLNPKDIEFMNGQIARLMEE